MDTADDDPDSDEEDVEGEEVFPEIDDVRHGRHLVCMGEDKPDRWSDWLNQAVMEFEGLEELANENFLTLDAGRKYGEINGWQDFCEKLGVDFSSDFWEGEMNSGQWVMGWISNVAILRAKERADTIVARLRKNLLKQARGSIAKELAAIGDLEELLNRTRNDRESLIQRANKLQTELGVALGTAAANKRTQEEMIWDDTSSLTFDCLRLAGAVLNGDRTVTLAGPLVLWSDGLVYALASRGGIPIPEGSAPSLLLRELERAGHRVIRVGEMTGYVATTSGPKYRKGAEHVSGWVNVWREIEQKRERKFIVSDPEHLPEVLAIHNHFRFPTTS